MCSSVFFDAVQVQFMCCRKFLCSGEHLIVFTKEQCACRTGFNACGFFVFRDSMGAEAALDDLGCRSIILGNIEGTCPYALLTSYADGRIVENGAVCRFCQSLYGTDRDTGRFFTVHASFVVLTFILQVNECPEEPPLSWFVHPVFLNALVQAGITTGTEPVIYEYCIFHRCSPLRPF